MTKKPAPEVFKLAMRFVRDILEHDTFDKRFHGRYLAEAKRLINPDDDLVPLDPEAVYGCLRAMKIGLFGFEGAIQYMGVITYSSADGGSYYEQYLKWAKEPPPWYLTAEVKLWELCTNLIAYPESSDIINHELPYPITP